MKKLMASLAALALMSCQAGTPVVTMIGEVGGFEISESVMTLKSKNSTDVFYVTGKCFGLITDIEVSFDNGATYSSLGQYAALAEQKCSVDGTFSFKIDPALRTEFNIPNDRSYKDFKFRGLSEFGMTSVKNLRRQVKLGDLQITSGSGSASVATASGTLTLKGRLVSTAVVNSTGSGYVFKGSIRIK